MEQFFEKNYKIFVVLMLGFMFVVSVLNAKNDSAIFDETAHIGAAYTYLHGHEMRLNPEHPPLIKDLAGIPLALMSLNFDFSQPFWTGDLPNKWDEGQWAAGRYLLYQAGNNADKIIFWARFPIILISLVLGLFIFKWTRELSGKLAGLFALALYSFNPNILGHNHYVTTDLGIAAFTCFAFYYFLKFIKKPTWKNVFIAGIFLALMQLAKFSSVLAFPVMGIVLVVFPLLLRQPESANDNSNHFKIKKLLEYLGKGAAAVFVSLLIVWFAYGINTYKTSRETMSAVIDFNFPEKDNDNPKNLYTNKALHLLNENSFTRPLSEYGIGFGYVFRRVAGGNGAYFLGQVSSNGFKSYFPVVFLIKQPLIDLFFMLGALLIAIITWLKNLKCFGQKEHKSLAVSQDIGPKSYSLTSDLKPKASPTANDQRSLRLKLIINISSIAMFSFIVLYSYFSITGNLNIGLRHLFPIFPFAFILTAKIIFDFLNKVQEKHRRAILYSSVLILTLILIFQTVRAYPFYLSYFNEAVGGPKNGYHLVTDSNADWGQDLKRLKIFLDKHTEIQNIKVDYFGGGDLDYYLGENNYEKWWDSKRPIEPGWYAISVNFIEGSIYGKEKPDNETYRWLLDYKPVYQVGTSILIYNISN